MGEIITREAAEGDLNTLVGKLISESIGKEIEKAAEGIYPLQNVLIRKVKTLRAPKLDVNKLLEIHGGAEAAAAVSNPIISQNVDTGKGVERPDEKKKQQTSA